MSLLFSLLAMQSGNPDIVVNAKRLEAAWTECRQKSCTPLRDAQTTIAMAEVQFRNGDYRKAGRTLREAIGRNRRHAATDPKPVAALYQAYANVSMHDGYKDLFRSATGSSYRTLRDHLPDGDPATFEAKLALGDMWAKLLQVNQADAVYEVAVRDARASGRETQALRAMVRRAWLASVSNQPGKASRLIDDIARTEGNADAEVRAILPVLRLRLAATLQDDAELDRRIAELGSFSAEQPVLIWQPTYSVIADAWRRRSFDLPGMMDPMIVGSSNVGGFHWADIGFWIRPDGRTDDVERLRGSKPGRWVESLLTQVRGRRYAQFPARSMNQGVYRIERMSLRNSYQVARGSFITTRAGRLGLEIMDLTETPGEAKPII